MFKKITLFILLTSSISSVVHAMDDSVKQKGTNWISKELRYTQHALERMEQRKITAKQIKRVLRNGKRSWEDDGSRRFTERKNKLNPLIVIANTKVIPNIVITAFKNDLTVTKGMAVYNSLVDQEYRQKQKAGKNKDLMRQHTAKTKSLGNFKKR